MCYAVLVLVFDVIYLGCVTTLSVYKSILVLLLSVRITQVMTLFKLQKQLCLVTYCKRACPFVSGVCIMYI